MIIKYNDKYMKSEKITFIAENISNNMCKL